MKEKYTVVDTEYTPEDAPSRPYPQPQPLTVSSTRVRLARLPVADCAGLRIAENGKIHMVAPDTGVELENSGAIGSMVLKIWEYGLGVIILPLFLGRVLGA